MTEDAAKIACPPPHPMTVPTYTADGYREFVQQAQQATADEYNPTGNAEFVVDSQRTTSQYDFCKSVVRLFECGSA
jgi:hypothetical protein